MHVCVCKRARYGVYFYLANKMVKTLVVTARYHAYYWQTQKRSDRLRKRTHPITWCIEGALVQDAQANVTNGMEYSNVFECGWGQKRLNWVYFSFLVTFSASLMWNKQHTHTPGKYKELLNSGEPLIHTKRDNETKWAESKQKLWLSFNHLTCSFA